MYVCRAFLNACFGRFKVGLKDLTGSPALIQKKCPHGISQNLIKGDSNERYDQKNHPCKISAKSAHYGQRYCPF